MRDYQLRIFLRFGEDRRLLMSITQKKGDFYVALGLARQLPGLSGIHLSYHRSGRRKFSPDVPKGMAPLFMDEPTHGIQGARQTALPSLRQL